MVLEKVKKSKMADPRWPPFENKTSLWHHMTSSADIADFKGNVSRSTICLPSFVFIALIFSELRGGSQKTKKKSPVWKGLIFTNHIAVLYKMTTRRLVKCTRETENRPEFGKLNYAKPCKRDPREKDLKFLLRQYYSSLFRTAFSVQSWNLQTMTP